MRIVVDGLPYPITITDDAAVETARFVAQAARGVAIVADVAVAGRANAIASALKEAGCHVLSLHTVVAGERFKRWRSVATLHDLWLASEVDRTSVAVAVGGGTTTDVVGLAAATYLRGVKWIPVATTLLGMVDAAIGGKTGVDLPQGKNLVGAVWHPLAVVADLAALETLPARVRSEAIPEMVKAAVIGDPLLLELIDGTSVDAEMAAWSELIARAAAVKARVVASDPVDSDARVALNLGHTFAHAFEHASRYRIRHGAAVALGLRAAGILARDRTRWSSQDQALMLRALRRHGLRIRLGRIDNRAVLEAMRVDKKRSSGSLRFVLPVRLGEVQTGVEAADDEVLAVLDQLKRAPARAGY